MWEDKPKIHFKKQHSGRTSRAWLRKTMQKDLLLLLRPVLHKFLIQLYVKFCFKMSEE